MRVAQIVLAAVLLAFGSACGGSSDDEEAAMRASTAPSTATSPPAKLGDYIAAINAICREHMMLVLKATGGGHPDHYPIATYEAEKAEMKALAAQFDEKVSAIPVPSDVREAAATLDAHRKGSDVAEARLAAAAATGDQAKFDAAYDANLTDFGKVAEQMLNTGFSPRCNAR